MATIQSSFVFQDKMSSAIASISNALESASINSKFAKENLDELERVQKEWKTTLDAANHSTVKNWENINKAQEEYKKASQAVDKATLQYLKYEGQVIKNSTKLEQMKQKQEDLNKKLQEGGDEAEKTAGKLTIFGVAIGSAIGNLASQALNNLKNSIGQAVTQASDLVEVQNVVDVAFGANADSINKWSRTALTQFGLNELSAKQFAGTMGAMLKSSGLTGDAVAGMSMKIAELAGDMASFYNLDPTEAFTKLRSGISGETEPLKQLGINMSVANLEAYALSQGLKVKYNDMSQAAQMTLRYQYLLQATADAQGDFARTSQTFANQQRLAEENTKKLSASIASLLLPALTMGYQVMNAGISFVADNLGTIVPLITAGLAVVTVAYVALKWEAIEAAIASTAAWFAATAPFWIIIGVLGVVSGVLNALGLSFTEQAQNIIISFHWVITSIKNVGIALYNTWQFAKVATKSFVDVSKLVFLNFFDWVLGKLSILAKGIDLVFKTNISGAIQNLSSASEKMQANLKEKIATNVRGADWKSFEANDIWTNQAKAQNTMNRISGAMDSLGTGGSALKAGMGIDPDLMTSSSGGKALKTKNQGKIEIKEEDMKLLHDIATRDYMINYQQLTPQVTLAGLTINELVDANQVVDMIVDGVAEAAEAKLQVRT